MFFPNRLPTGAKRGGEAVLRDVEALSRELMNKAEATGMRVVGIGICVAELVDLEGNVTSGSAIKWKGWPIRERLSRIAPAVIEADVRASALAEAIFGAGRDHRIFLYLTVGTGISCCLVMDKRPYAGARGGALVCASGPLTSTCAECGAINALSLEEYAAGPALVRRYASEKISLAEEVVEAAQSGDARAIEIVRSAGEALGATTGLLINTLDPEAVVVGGGLGRADGLYWECFLRSTRKHIWAEAGRDIPIKHAALAENGVIGAAIKFLRGGGYPDSIDHCAAPIAD